MSGSEPGGRQGRDIEGLIDEVVRERVSRREFCARALGLGLTASAVGGLLAACGDEPAPTASPSPPPLSPLDTALPTELRIFNWGTDLPTSVKRGFHEKYGIGVVEESFETSGLIGFEAMRQKVIADGLDVIVLSDGMVQAFRDSLERVRETSTMSAGATSSAAGHSTLQPLHLELLHNLGDVQPLLRNPPYDSSPDGIRYSVPLQWGATGIAVRTDNVSETITRWAQLFPPKGSDFRGQIQMLNDARECCGVALLKNAHSINSTSQDELDEATRDLVDQKPLVIAYDSVNMKRAMVRGVPLVVCWPNDVIAARRAGVPESDFAFVYPEEGFAVWADTMCIPSGARSPYAAHLFLDYMCDPRVSAGLVNQTGTFAPFASAAEYVDEQILRLRPAEDQLERSEIYMWLGEFTMAYERAWAEVKSA